MEKHRENNQCFVIAQLTRTASLCRFFAVVVAGTCRLMQRSMQSRMNELQRKQSIEPFNVSKSPFDQHIFTSN